MSVRKRSGSGGRRALKEKIVEVYEGLFRGDQISLANSNYWEEFFLLKPKISVLEVGKYIQHFAILNFARIRRRSASCKRTSWPGCGKT